MEETKIKKGLTGEQSLIVGLLEDIRRNTLIAAKPILTIEEAGMYLGFRPKYMLQMAVERTIPHYRTGKSRRYYFKREELDAWMTSRKVEAREEADAAAILRDYINS